MTDEQVYDGHHVDATVTPALETFVIIALYKSTFTIPYHTRGTTVAMYRRYDHARNVEVWRPGRAPDQHFDLVLDLCLERFVSVSVLRPNASARPQRQNFGLDCDTEARIFGFGLSRGSSSLSRKFLSVHGILCLSVAVSIIERQCSRRFGISDEYSWCTTART